MKNKIRPTDKEIINFMIETYLADKRLPNRATIREVFNMHPQKIADFYKRNAKLFIKRKGAKVQPSKKLMKKIKKADKSKENIEEILKRELYQLEKRRKELKAALYTLQTIREEITL